MSNFTPTHPRFLVRLSLGCSPWWLVSLQGRCRRAARLSDPSFTFHITGLSSSKAMLALLRMTKTSGSKIKPCVHCAVRSAPASRNMKCGQKEAMTSTSNVHSNNSHFAHNNVFVAKGVESRLLRASLPYSKKSSYILVDVMMAMANLNLNLNNF